jgi:hypothetical protein
MSTQLGGAGQVKLVYSSSEVRGAEERTHRPARMTTTAGAAVPSEVRVLTLRSSLCLLCTCPLPLLRARICLLPSSSALSSVFVSRARTSLPHHASSPHALAALPLP